MCILQNSLFDNHVYTTNAQPIHMDIITEYISHVIWLFQWCATFAHGCSLRPRGYRRSQVRSRCRGLDYYGFRWTIDVSLLLVAIVIDMSCKRWCMFLCVICVLTKYNNNNINFKALAFWHFETKISGLTLLVKIVSTVTIMKWQIFIIKFKMARIGLTCVFQNYIFFVYLRHCYIMITHPIVLYWIHIDSHVTFVEAFTSVPCRFHWTCHFAFEIWDKAQIRPLTFWWKVCDVPGCRGSSMHCPYVGICGTLCCILLLLPRLTKM